MRIWLLTIGEPLPLSGAGAERPHRTGYLADLLAQKGHEVVWWTSSFDHFKKAHLAESDSDFIVREGLRIKLLHGCGYRKNISFSRLLDHRQIAEKFSQSSRAIPHRPDIILSSWPTIELSLAAVRYGKDFNVPVVLDMRDMWPDIFVDSVPAILRPFARLLLLPMFREARQACSGATAITGITRSFVEWGIARAGRGAGRYDRDFPMGYSIDTPAESELSRAGEYWDSLGVTAASRSGNLCFFGALGHQLDVETLIDAARILSQTPAKWRFIICGAGDQAAKFRKLAANLPNVLMPGWVDRAKIFVLMRRSVAGLNPLPERYDFLGTINNKAIEYMSAGLPVILSPAHGLLAELLANTDSGVSYEWKNSAKLADLLGCLWGDMAKLSKMGQNARSLFESSFRADRVYSDMERYLGEVAAHSKAECKQGISHGH